MFNNFHVFLLILIPIPPLSFLVFYCAKSVVQALRLRLLHYHVVITPDFRDATPRHEQLPSTIINASPRFINLIHIHRTESNRLLD
jgi:hypothetical protein